MKVSVITIVRNDVQHIEQTMLSVLGQTYPDVEYIVIDGGSTDGTTDVIKKYADRLAYWVSEPDGGIYPAMNKGVEHATGEWVNFMNSGDAFADDRVLEDIFTLQPQSLTTLQPYNLKPLQPYNLIGGNTINFYADGHEETHYAEPASVLPTRLPFSHQASFVRREVCKFDVDYKLAADYALFNHIYYKYGEKSVLVVDRAIARYRQEDSTTMKNARAVKGEYLAIQSYHPTWHWVKEYLKWKWL